MPDDAPVTRTVAPSNDVRAPMSRTVPDACVRFRGLGWRPCRRARRKRGSAARWRSTRSCATRAGSTSGATCSARRPVPRHGRDAGGTGGIQDVHRRFAAAGAAGQARHPRVGDRPRRRRAHRAGLDGLPVRGPATAGHLGRSLPRRADGERGRALALHAARDRLHRRHAGARPAGARAEAGPLPLGSGPPLRRPGSSYGAVGRPNGGRTERESCEGSSWAASPSRSCSSLAACGTDDPEVDSSSTSTTTSTTLDRATATAPRPSRPAQTGRPAPPKPPIPASNAEEYVDALIDAWVSGDRDAAEVARGPGRGRHAVLLRAGRGRRGPDLGDPDLRGRGRLVVLHVRRRWRPEDHRAGDERGGLEGAARGGHRGQGGKLSRLSLK